MNKGELAAAIAEKSGLTKKDALAAGDAFVEAVEEAVAAGNKVQLIGFGSFERGERAARAGRNPNTGKAIKIPATKTVKFKAGSEFKVKVNAKKEKKARAKKKA